MSGIRDGLAVEAIKAVANTALSLAAPAVTAWLAGALLHIHPLGIAAITLWAAWAGLIVVSRYLPHLLESPAFGVSAAPYISGGYVVIQVTNTGARRTLTAHAKSIVGVYVDGADWVRTPLPLRWDHTPDNTCDFGRKSQRLLSVCRLGRAENKAPVVTWVSPHGDVESRPRSTLDRTFQFEVELTDGDRSAALSFLVIEMGTPNAQVFALAH